MSNKRSLESQSGEGLGGKGYRYQPHFHCATLISSEDSATIHAPKYRNTNLGFSDAT